MTDTYRDLCAELADDLEPWITYGEIEAIEKSHDLIDRARAALAEPVQEGPSDKEIMALMPQQMHEDLAAAARAMAGFDSPKAAMGAIRNILNCHAVDHARAVLDRWGSAN